MSRITEIERKIQMLGAGEFQKFCDTFLSKKDMYGTILGLGMRTGTLKTTTGNPDTYFVRETGKYVFVAYTTQQVSIYNKLKEDIEKCLDPQKTGVQLKDIDEIVCCHTSSNLSAGDNQKLRKLCSDKGILLTLFGVDEIAQQIYSKYPVIAKDFLNIPIDTNQILIIEDFINLYNSSETAAPLNTAFQNRVEELKTLKADIRNNKVVVVHGLPGVGKTRIVLEAIRAVSREDGYKLLCVKNKNLPLYEDLVANTDKAGSYLFFVDDANELSGLDLILEYVNRPSKNGQIRIILTVRDYIKATVIRNVAKYVTPSLFELQAFTDNEIKDFLSVNMQITNDLYVNPIVSIAKGNPRIAYMAGKLARDKQSLDAVHDATQVYEEYYASIIQTTLGDNKDLCLTAGILALVRSVILDKLDYLVDILKIGNLSRDEFTECIRQLSSMEVVEIYKDKVAVISDQCLANYMLYYVFFAQKRIPFSEVLSVGFINVREGVIQSVNTLLNLFFRDELCSYIESEVAETWENLKKEHSPYFDDFAREFHLFRPEAAFAIAFDKIDNIKQEQVLDEVIDFEKDSFNSDDKILDFLTGYRYTDHLKTALELLMEYAQKSKINATIAFSWLKNHVCVRSDSYRNDYYVENVAARIMGEHTDRNIRIQKLILAYMDYLLGFEFHQAEVGRENTVTMYTIQISNSEGVKKFRTICWQNLKILSEKPELQDEILKVMQRYSRAICREVDTSIVFDDKVFCIDILYHLKANSLSKALIARDLHYAWKKLNIAFEEKESIFQFAEWKLYELLEDEYRYSGVDYKEYEEQRKERLIRYAIKMDASDIPTFVQSVTLITKDMDYQRKYSITCGVEVIIERLCRNIDIAWTVFMAVLEYGGDIGINSSIILKVLFEGKSSKEIWETIERHNFSRRNEWELSFFQELPSEQADKYTYDLLLDFLNCDSDRSISMTAYRDLKFLNKFYYVDADIYVTASRLVFQKRSYSSYIVDVYFHCLFNEHSNTPEEVISYFSSDMKLLRDIYFFVLRHNQHVDYYGKFLRKFLPIDDSWIASYAEVVCEGIPQSYIHNYEHERYKMLWMSEDYERYFDCIFETASKMNGLYFRFKIAGCFKVMLGHGDEEVIVSGRQMEWVEHIVRKYAKDDKIVFLFSALSECEYDLRRRAFRDFLQLNTDYEMFKKLPLDPSHWGGEMGEIIADLHKKIEFLESLHPYVQGIKYIKHASRIRERIAFWKDQIEHEELEAICRKL